MGAWGYGPFDNDAAADWKLDLGDAGDPRTLLLETFAEGGEDYLDAHEGSRIVAAACWLVSTESDRQQWYPAGTLPAPPPLDTDLRVAASRAVEAVLSPASEWRQLWDEVDATAPISDLIDVQTRLAR